DIHVQQEGGEGDMFPMPSILFGINEKLAHIESQYRGTAYLQSMMGVSGTKVHPTALGTRQSALLPARQENEYSSKTLEQRLPELLRADPALIDPQGRILNPILDPKDLFKVHDIYLDGGIIDRMTERGIDIHHMSPV